MVLVMNTSALVAVPVQTRDIQGGGLRWQGPWDYPRMGHSFTNSLWTTTNFLGFSTGFSNVLKPKILGRGGYDAAGRAEDHERLALFQRSPVVQRVVAVGGIDRYHQDRTKIYI